MRFWPRQRGCFFHPLSNAGTTARAHAIPVMTTPDAGRTLTQGAPLPNLPGEYADALPASTRLHEFEILSVESDSKVSGLYAFWKRQIARQTAQAKVCMNIVGHTSRTGGDACNDKLSAQRAAVIKQKLGTEAAELVARTRTSGVGFKENIIETATDDAADSLDRRVEFKIVAC